MKKSLRKQCYITIENNKIIGSQLFNIAYLINILKTKNNEHIKRKIVFNKDNKLYYDTLFKGLFNILDNEKYDSIKFKIVDTADILNDDNDDAANNIKICKESLDKLYTFKDIDDELRKKIIELVYSNEDLMYSAYYKYRDVLNHFGNNTTDNDVAVIHFMKNPDVDYYNNALSFLRDAYKVTNIAVITDDINWAKIALNDINENACFSCLLYTSDAADDIL
jgi:ACT domain-containing protein